MRHHLLPFGLVLAGLSTAAAGQSLPAQERLSDNQLSALRGGFALPGGVTISLGVITESRIDSVLVTRTTYTLDQGAPHVDVSTSALPQSSTDSSIHVVEGRNGTQIQFSGRGVDITSIAGRAFGTVVTNSTNDRTIDVATTVNVNIGGLSPDQLGSSSIRASELALDSTRLLTR